MSNRKTEIGVDHHYAVFKTISHVGDSTTMKVRRVDPQSTDEHVQIDFDSVKKGEKRDTYGSGYIQLTPEQAEVLIKALRSLVPNNPSRSQSFSVIEAATAERLGIPNKRLS